ncbi:MAG: LCP family protein [Lactimicrobium sp.]|jgi:LCP family protein required for cell wall assembly|uniref:LCP family glycopolymer transferase n=1 Tax=Lactimicrobium sp. TaxID=2563780 RepID=UPI002F35A519
MSKRKKKKRVLSARFVWLFVLISAAVFALIIFGLAFLPDDWKLMALIVIAAIVFLTGILSYAFQKSRFIKTIDVILIIALVAADVLVPHYESLVDNLFENVIGNKTTVRLYVMNEDYRSAHPEYFSDSSVSTSLSDYGSASFATCLSSDKSNQSYALQQVESQLGNVDTVDCSSVTQEAEYLYTAQADVMVLSDAYVSMITDQDIYANFKNETTVIASYTIASSTASSTEKNALTEHSFTIFIGGNDQEGELYTEGRTDVDMILTVNPTTHQIAIVSMPRDSYIPNPAYGTNAYDKLTHLGLSGIQNTLDGLNSYMGLGDTLSHYVIVNFTTFRTIIDALDGVDVDNPFAFDSDQFGPHYEFSEGTIHLDGEYALAYARERYHLPNGDFDRNMHQQLLMKAIIEKLTSASVVVHLESLLKSLDGQFLTDLSGDSIYAFAKMQLSENISWNIVNYHVLGETGSSPCASAGGEYLSVVYPYDNQVEFVAQVIQDVINGSTVEQQDLPDGSYDNSSSSGTDSYSSGSDGYYGSDSNSSYDFNYNYAEMGSGGY